MAFQAFPLLSFTIVQSVRLLPDRRRQIRWSSVGIRLFLSKVSVCN
jgi:hypothetical protein